MRMRMQGRAGRRRIAVSAVCLTMMLTGCAGDGAKENETAEEILIPVTFLVNPDTGENENEELVDAFNEEYEGIYQLDVEWITDTAEGYRARIKTLNGLDKLPAVITDAGFDADFYELLIENDRLVDLGPYLTEDDIWREAYGERELSLYREEDEGVYLSPSGNASLSYAGFYYNKELFAQAGIGQFPDTWEDFFAALETLEKANITPLALHGGSSYWTALLMATGYTAGTADGMAFLQTQYPQDYENESAAELFAVLKRFYDYADEDALEIERTESAKRFAAGEAAVTANGGWMIFNFTDEQKARTGFAPFPGNILMEDMKMSAWAVTAGYPQEVERGAAEFLRFRALRDLAQEAEYFSAEAEYTVEREYKQSILQAETVMPNYQLKWEAGIQEEYFVNELPLFVREEITQEEFLRGLSRAAADIRAEK